MMSAVALLDQLRDVDVLIAGAGLAGNSAALALSGLGLRLAIIDNKPVSSVLGPGGEKNASKALALSLSSQRFLETLGLWKTLAPCVYPISSVHVSEKGRFGRVQLKAEAVGLPALGFVVDSGQLEAQLQKQVQQCPDVQIVQGTITDQRQFNNPLLIAADGAQSLLRTQAGIGVTVHDYAQTAIVVNLALQNAVNGRAYERFICEGSIALLPFGHKQVKCVWVLPTEKAKAMCDLPETAFLKTLSRDFGHRLGPFLSMGVRTTYPLTSRIADRLYAHRLVLIGNAAATLHPIAAQGFNLAVRDIAALAEQVWAAKQAGQAIGSTAVLGAYAKQRTLDRKEVIDLNHLLARGFESTTMPIQCLRHWGLVLCECFSFLKEGIIKRGTGFQNPLPKLCRGVPLCP